MTSEFKSVFTKLFEHEPGLVWLISKRVADNATYSDVDSPKKLINFINKNSIQPIPLSSTIHDILIGTMRGPVIMQLSNNRHFELSFNSSLQVELDGIVFNAEYDEPLIKVYRTTPITTDEVLLSSQKYPYAANIITKSLLAAIDKKHKGAASVIVNAVGGYSPHIGPMLYGGASEEMSAAEFELNEDILDNFLTVPVMDFDQILEIIDEEMAEDKKTVKKLKGRGKPYTLQGGGTYTSIDASSKQAQDVFTAYIDSTNAELTPDELKALSNVGIIGPRGGGAGKFVRYVEATKRDISGGCSCVRFKELPKLEQQVFNRPPRGKFSMRGGHKFITECINRNCMDNYFRKPWDTLVEASSPGLPIDTFDLLYGGNDPTETSPMDTDVSLSEPVAEPIEDKSLGEEPIEEEQVIEEDPAPKEELVDTETKLDKPKVKDINLLVLELEQIIDTDL